MQRLASWRACSHDDNDNDNDDDDNDVALLEFAVGWARKERTLERWVLYSCQPSFFRLSFSLCGK